MLIPPQNSHLMMIMMLFIFANVVSDDVWLIDLGASYYMNPHKEWFSSYKGYDGGDVFLGDNSMKKGRW